MVSFLKKNSFLLIFVVLAAASILFCSKFLFPLNTVVFEESYLQQCSYLDINILSIVNSGRIPFWSFHFGGGYPFIQHPENISLSPLFYLLVLPFGSAIGMKLMIIFAYFTGIFGMLLFCRKVLKYNIWASLFSSSIFIFSSFIPFQINTGNTRDPGWLYLPLLLFFITKAVKHLHFLFFSSLMIVFLLFNGFNLYIAPLFLFLLVYSLLEDTSHVGENITIHRKHLLTPRFLTIIFLTFLLGSAKILPLLELLSHNARSFNAYSAASSGAMTFAGFLNALLVKGPFAVGNEAAAGPNGLGMGCVFYFGYIPLFLFFSSLILCFKKIWKYFLLFTLFLLLSMANNFHFDLFNLLWRFPIFSSIHEPARYFGFPVVFTFSIISGAVLNSSFFVRRGRVIIISVSLLALYAVCNMYVSNSQYYDFTGKMHIRTPKENWKENVFFNVKAVPFQKKKIGTPVRSEFWDIKYANELVPGIQYFLLRQNIGLINWFGNIELKENAVEKYKVTLGYGSYWKDLRQNPSPSNGVIENNDYKGECYFNNSPETNHVKDIQWKSNEILIDTEQSNPDVLIINQNYNKNWKVSSGKLINKNGLLGIFLNNPVKRKIRLHYFPVYFFIGTAISLISFILCFVKLGLSRGK